MPSTDSPAAGDLACHVPARSDIQHAIHRGQIGWVARVADLGQPAADRAPSQRQRRRGQCPGIGGVDARSQTIQQIGVIAQHVSLPGQDGHQIAAGQFGQQR